MSRYNSSNMPGPGDPETWGPCTGHPNDPRTVDEGEVIQEKRVEMLEERVREDLAWVVEAFTEYTDVHPFETIRQAFLKQDFEGMGKAVAEIIERSVKPDDAEAVERLQADNEGYDGD